MGKAKQVQLAASILFSAGTYLLDYFSNIAVTLKYYQRSSSSSSYAHLFYTMLVLLLASHVFNAIFFLLKFPWSSSSATLRAAYFLPLIQLYRLFNLAWNSRGLDALKDVTSTEMNILFSILATSMESGPLLTLQFLAVNFLPKKDIRVTALISIAASLASVTYNVGMAIMLTSKNVATRGYKVLVVVATGIFSSCALILRCFTYFWVCEAFMHTWLPPTILCLGLLAIDWVVFLLLLTPQTCNENSTYSYKKFMRSFGFSHMSYIVGPLYPMVDEGKEKNVLGQPVFRFKILCMAIEHVIPDIIVTSLFISLRGFEFPRYLVSVGVFGALYIISITCYIWIDKRCGFRHLEKHGDQELYIIDEEDICDDPIENIDRKILPKRQRSKICRSLSLP